MTDATRLCHLCRRASVQTLIAFGPQPVCNRLVRDPEAPEFTHPMTLTQCARCGLVQISESVPVDELRPREPVAYNEPEAHLDRLAQVLRELPGITRDSVVAGVTSKDDSLLRRLAAGGVTRTWRIDPGDDLGIRDPCAGLETLQARLGPEEGARLAATHGQAHLVIARHIVEHAHQLRRFLDGLSALVAPEGHLVFEVPDCQRAMERMECTMAWEEHVLYLTEQTLRRLPAAAGLSLVRLDRFAYPMEDSLVLIAQRRSPPAYMPEGDPSPELQRAQAFAQGVGRLRQDVARWLDQTRRRSGPVALLGAGHHGGAFINLLGLQRQIAFVVDDHPAKQGAYMPGSKVPIRPSAALYDRGVGVCLLSLSPESQHQALQRHQRFLQQGGRFVSIFGDHPWDVPSSTPAGVG